MKIYQISPEALSLMMCYVIKTDNDRIIVIDGGRDGYGLEAEPYLQSAIRAVLGLGQDDYFEVDAWFLSHAHTDHIYELAKMLNLPEDKKNFKIKNFYFDFPDVGNEWSSQGGPGDHSMKAMEALRKGIPDYDRVNGGVINTQSVEKGLTIEVDGVYFDILRTWTPEDRIVNSTSIIFKMRFGSHSVLFLGDTYIDASDKLLERYGADALKSEYVQMAHHGQNGPDEKFYKAIGAENSIRLWPTPIWVWNVYKSENFICTDKTREWLGLPGDFNEFAEKKLNKTGRDFVAGMADFYPADPLKVSDWTDDVLESQRVF